MQPQFMIVHFTESEWLYCPSEKIIKRNSYMTKKKVTTGLETTLTQTKCQFILGIVDQNIIFKLLVNKEINNT